MSESLTGALEVNPNSKFLENPIAAVQSLIKNLGLDKITNKKLRRFVVNAAVALSFLSAMPQKADAQTVLDCVITNSNTTNVNIREAPGTNNPIEGSLLPTDVAQYQFSDDGWHLIENGTTTGWVWGDITKLVNCEEAEHMIEGINDNSGVVLTPREYPEDNIIIFGDQDVLTNEQVLELNRLIDERTGNNRTYTCDLDKPRLIIFANLKQMYQLQRQFERMGFHSFAGYIDYDGTTLWPNNGYCNSNTYNAAVVNVEQVFRWRSEEYTTTYATAHEVSHLYNTYDGVRAVPSNSGLELGNAYYNGLVAGEASEGRCSTYTNEGTAEYCNELEQVFEEQ